MLLVARLRLEESNLKRLAMQQILHHPRLLLIPCRNSIITGRPVSQEKQFHVLAVSPCVTS